METGISGETYVRNNKETFRLKLKKK